MLQRCVVMIVLVVPIAAFAGPTRVAVWSADEKVVGLVEAKLSSDAQLQLVERAELKRIVGEQKLTLDGLADHEQAIGVGKIMNADVLVCIDAVDSGGWALVAFDGSTGRRLRDVVVAEATVEASADRLAALVKEAVAKMTQPGGQTVCLLSVRNADLPRQMTGLCDAAGVLLQRQLMDAPMVAVLERSRLDKLTQERSLPTATEAGNRLLASVNLVELQIGRSRNPAELRIIAIITDHVGKEIARAETVAKPDATSVARATTPMVLEKLGTTAANPAPVNLRTEAQRFVREASFRAAHKDWPAAIAAMEAAHALDPENLSVHVQLARTLTDAGLNWGAINDGHIPLKASSEDKAAAFGLMQRALDELTTLALMPPAPDGSHPSDFPAYRDTTGLHRKWLAMLKWNLRKLRPGEQVQLTLSEELRSALERLTADYRHLRLDIEKPYHFSQVKDEASFEAYSEFLRVLIVEASYIFNPTVGEGTKDVQPLLLEWLKLQQMLNAKLGPDSQMLVASLGDGNWLRRGESLSIAPESQAMTADDILRMHVVYGLMAASKDSVIAEAGRKRSAQTVEQIARLQQTTVSQPAEAPDPRSPRLNLSAPKAELVDGHAFWDEFRVLIDVLNNDVGIVRLTAPVVHDGFVYVVGTERMPSRPLTAVLLKIPLAGGEPVVVRRFTPSSRSGLDLPTMREASRMERLQWNSSTRSAPATEKYLVLHTSSEPLLLPYDGGAPIPVRPQEDWPAKRIQSLTVLGDSLYVALGEPGKEGFLIEQPVNGGPVNVLAASMRKEKLSPFDDQPPLRAVPMACDPARNRILFFAHSDKWDRSQTGIWEFNPRTRQFKHLAVVPVQENAFMDYICWGQIAGDRLPMWGAARESLNLKTSLLEGAMPGTSDLPVLNTDEVVWAGMHRMYVQRGVVEDLPVLRAGLPGNVTWPTVMYPIDNHRLLVGDAAGLFVIAPPLDLRGRPKVDVKPAPGPGATTAPSTPGGMDVPPVTRRGFTADILLPWTEARPLYDFADGQSPFLAAVSPVLSGDSLYVLGVTAQPSATLLRFSIRDGAMQRLSQTKVNVPRIPTTGPTGRRASNLRIFGRAVLTSAGYCIATEGVGIRVFPLDPQGEVREIRVPFGGPYRLMDGLGDRVFFTLPGDTQGLAYVDVRDAVPKIQRVTGSPTTQPATRPTTRPESPLDAISPLSIVMLEADPERQRVVLMVHCGDPDPQINGLWSYALGTGEIKQLLPLMVVSNRSAGNREPHAFPLFRWSQRCGDTLLIGMAQGIIAYDLKTDSARVLCQAGNMFPALSPEARSRPDFPPSNSLLNGQIHPMELRPPIVLQGEWLWYQGGRVSLDGTRGDNFPPLRKDDPDHDFGSQWQAISPDGRYRFAADQRGCWVYTLKP